MQLPAEDLLVLACEMLLMESTVLSQLYQRSKTHTAEAFVFTNEGTYEPLCGIYTAAGLSRIIQLLKEKRLAKNSMKHVLEQLSSFAIEMVPAQKRLFRNFNTGNDLNGL